MIISLDLSWKLNTNSLAIWLRFLNRAKTHFGLLLNFDKQLAADDVDNAAFALSLRKMN